ncbi:uncharacterized protein N7482_006032 [Penicillium canariense]|uniref:Uncharacterized protein n=1 Tax=Penicillium canariense TaxID=189055 RepID=A0A9W9I578_9EURO|nr:uncharacterized protein N7482_006032 [Penicillium canariense]KAJ5167251.1 hypothetical protein N7482_006032 [Penicillium canariense]
MSRSGAGLANRLSRRCGDGGAVLTCSRRFQFRVSHLMLEKDDELPAEDIYCPKKRGLERR